MNPTIVLLSIYHVPIINYAWGTEKSCQPLKLPNTKYIYCQLQITAKTTADFYSLLESRENVRAEGGWTGN